LKLENIGVILFSRSKYRSNHLWKSSGSSHTPSYW